MRVGCVSGLGHSVRQWVKTKRRRRQAGRRPARGRAGAFPSISFSPCTGARGRGAGRCLLPSSPGHAGDRRPPRPCRLAYGGGTPAGRGRPHLSAWPWKKRSASLRPCPSVRSSVNRPSAGGQHRQCKCMHTQANTSPERNNTKMKNHTAPITLSLLSLS